MASQDTQTIQAWAMTAVGEPLKRIDIDSGKLDSSEVLVEVKGCGICHTDLGYLFDGVPVRSELPLVLGHEISGTVVECGDEVKDWAGKSVIVPAVMPCGECSPCKRGKTGICHAQIFPGNDIHGGFASHVKVPAKTLCAVPKSLVPKLNQLSVIADAVTTPLNAIEQSGLSEGQVAVIVGAGGIGAFAVQIAKSYGAHVVALDIHDDRLALMSDNGADFIFNVSDKKPKEVKKAIRAHAKEQGWPTSEWCVFETSGNTAGQELAFSLLNFGATLMVVGYSPKKVTVPLSNLMAFEARAQGVWGCPPPLYDKAIELVESGDVMLEPFIEEHPMSDINEILTALHHGKLRRRVVLNPDF